MHHGQRKVSHRGADSDGLFSREGREDNLIRFSIAFSSHSVQVQHDSSQRRTPLCPHVTSVHKLIGYATPAGSGADDTLIIKYMLAFLLYTYGYKELTHLSPFGRPVTRLLDVDRPHNSVFMSCHYTVLHPAYCAMFILIAQSNRQSNSLRVTHIVSHQALYLMSMMIFFCTVSVMTENDKHRILFKKTYKLTNPSFCLVLETFLCAGLVKLNTVLGWT